MNCIILAAGFATRMYPLTQDCPKALLPIKCGTVIDHLIDDILKLQDVNNIYIISNEKYMSKFSEWSIKKNNSKLHIISNGVKKINTSKGILYTLKEFHKEIPVDDTLLIASDNILDFSLKGFIEYYKQRMQSCVMYHFEENIERLRTTGVAHIIDSKIIEMQEKPEVPLYSNAIPPFYIYTQNDMQTLIELASQGVEVDSMGSMIVIMHKLSNIYAYKMPGKRVDIGTLDKYKKYIGDHIDE